MMRCLTVWNNNDFKKVKVLTQNIGNPEIIYDKQYSILVNISEVRRASWCFLL